MAGDFVIGIDLGTTNSVAAIAASLESQVLPLTQLGGVGTLVDRVQLPSAIYLPFEGQFEEGKLDLPWASGRRNICGVFAKELGENTPDRLITSAKSWLCNSRVDRRDSILPWQSEISSGKLSPFEASRQILENIFGAIKHRVGEESAKSASIVVTVPASFDEVARNLTLEAAAAAGLGEVSLLEEPLAALYAWISRSGDSWRRQISPGQLILVCDLGGGTADFSLVLASDKDGELSLERVAVGRHLLLGGDNIDLALAYKLRSKLEEEGRQLDAWQFRSLIYQAQKAKEKLLSDSSMEHVQLAVAGRGSDLFASTLQVELEFQEVKDLVLDGFFPEMGLEDLENENSGLGIRELGLSFESDPAFSRHLLRFLLDTAVNTTVTESLYKMISRDGEKAIAMPDVVLFNGGVCKSNLIRERILGLLKCWGNNRAICELADGNYDTAVAEGAAHFGWIRNNGQGIRIRAGISHSYYLGLESSAPAIPGMRAPVKGICVVPKGMEEGTEFTLENKEFSLLTGEPVEFRFFTSDARGDDHFGLLVENVEKGLQETSRLQLTLETAGVGQENMVPVKLHSKVSDVGVLELWMVATDGRQRWKLEFDVRAEKKSLEPKI